MKTKRLFAISLAGLMTISACSMGDTTVSAARVKDSVVYKESDYN